jgi:hypothetical protein
LILVSRCYRLITRYPRENALFRPYLSNSNRILQAADYLTNKRPRPRDGVACRFRPVHLKLYAGIGALVRTRKGHISRVEGASAGCEMSSGDDETAFAIVSLCRTTLNVQLCALHVKLSTRVARRSMQSDDFSSEKISKYRQSPIRSRVRYGVILSSGHT